MRNASRQLHHRQALPADQQLLAPRATAGGKARSARLTAPLGGPATRAAICPTSLHLSLVASLDQSDLQGVSTEFAAVLAQRAMARGVLLLPLLLFISVGALGEPGA